MSSCFSVCIILSCLFFFSSFPGLQVDFSLLISCSYLWLEFVTGKRGKCNVSSNRSCGGKMSNCLDDIFACRSFD